MSSGRFMVVVTITITLGLSCTAIAQSIQAQADATEFEYTGDNGPGFWGSLNEDWRACDGSRQSPVNLERAVRDTGLGPLRLDLRDTQSGLTNNGHTIQQDYDRGSSLILDGAVFDLVQFHFHSLSEHTVNGQHSHGASRGVSEFGHRESRSDRPALPNWR